jgi:Fe-S cluster assembly protein SufD
MTLAVTKTKAEQALSHNFEAVAAKLPGGHAVAEARKAAIGAFAALGLPHRRLEQWKYTDLRSALKEALVPAVRESAKATPAEIDAALEGLASLDSHRLVFVDGAHVPEISTPGALKGVEIASLAAELAKPENRAGDGLIRESVPGQDAVIALNTAYMTDGAVVRVGKGAKLDKPLLLVFTRAGREGRLVTTRNVIKLEDGARATVIEAHVALPGAASGQANTLSEVSVGDGARLAHITCTLSGPTASHLSTSLATLGKAAVYRAFQLTASTGLVRNTVFAAFKGEGAKLDISGSFLGRGAEHIDTTLVVDHAVPGCESRELFKGVLTDRARGVFQGKVIVRPNAQKSDGKQMAQVLMLSEDAEFDSKPELEIHADDVVCGHGSTAAELDEDLLFYMRARGIPLEEARAMLVESFIGEAIDKVDDERLRTVLASMASPRLSQLSGAGPEAPRRGGGRT